MPTQTWQPRFPKDYPSGPPGELRRFFANSPYLAFIKLARTDAVEGIKVVAHMLNKNGETWEHELLIGMPPFYDTAQNLTLTAWYTQGVVVPKPVQAKLTVTWQRDDFPERRD